MLLLVSNGCSEASAFFVAAAGVVVAVAAAAVDADAFAPDALVYVLVFVLVFGVCVGSSTAVLLAIFTVTVTASIFVHSCIESVHTFRCLLAQELFIFVFGSGFQDFESPNSTYFKASARGRKLKQTIMYHS